MMTVVVMTLVTLSALAVMAAGIWVAVVLMSTLFPRKTSSKTL
jgi:hypothetical protein